jgi:hypothetical protein
VAQDHNDIYSIVERLRILEEGLDKNQRSVNQLSATFKPKTVAVLTAKTDPKNPLGGKLVGDSTDNNREPVEEAVANEDVLDKVKASFADYLKSVADEVKQDSDIKEKSKVDHDLGKKDTRDRDLIAKDKKEKVSEEELDEDRLSVGDPVTVTAPNEYEGKTGEVIEFAPSGKFVVIKLYNGDEASMHVSDVEYNEYADEQDVDDAWNDDEPMEIPVSEDPTTDDETIEAPPAPVENPVMPESVAVKTITNECGLWEIHGNEPSGFEIRHGNNAMRSRFKTIDEAEMALEMFAARRRKADESADYIEEC